MLLTRPLCVCSVCHMESRHLCVLSQRWYLVPRVSTWSCSQPQISCPFFLSPFPFCPLATLYYWSNGKYSLLSQSCFTSCSVQPVPRLMNAPSRQESRHRQSLRSTALPSPWVISLCLHHLTYEGWSCVSSANWTRVLALTHWYVLNIKWCTSLVSSSQQPPSAPTKYVTSASRPSWASCPPREVVQGQQLLHSLIVQEKKSTRAFKHKKSL